jgi:hypothetical protein
LKNVHLNPYEELDTIIGYSIVNFAKKNHDYKMHDVLRQVLYDLYRNENMMQNELRKNLVKYIHNEKFSYDDDYNGFDTSGQFSPDENMAELQKIIETDKELENLMIFHYKLHSARQMLNIKGGNNDTLLSKYEVALKQIQKHESQYGKDPTPGIKTSIIFDFRDHKTNSPDEIQLLCAAIGLRSLIGQKPFTATNKSGILMRMLGAKSKAVLEDYLNDADLKVIYQKYSNRYHFEKLMEKLRIRKFLNSKIGMYRKLFCSAELNMQQLEISIVEWRRKRSVNLLKDQEKLARQRILAASI